MILLALDTSGPVAGVAVLQDGRVRYEAMAVNKMTHSESIMPMAEEALRRTALEKGDLTHLAVTVGPGSFTGVRIGVTAVKALSHALGIPCIAVDALEATAAGLENRDETVCPIQDARVQQVYGAAFRGGVRLLDDCVLKLDEYLEQQGKLPFEKLFRLFSPLMQSLSRVHSTGLIHRDISPQNIMVLPDETLILLDFGAAREYGESKETSLSVILKHGYSPSEQYMSHGRQGPWTDVYALCATMYRMLTTVMPPTAVERMASDKLEKPSKLGAEISPAEEEVLLHAVHGGAALGAEERVEIVEAALDGPLQDRTGIGAGAVGHVITGDVCRRAAGRAKAAGEAAGEV